MSLTDSGVTRIYQMVHDAEERAHEARQAARESNIAAGEAKSQVRRLRGFIKFSVLAHLVQLIAIASVAAAVLLRAGCTYVDVQVRDLTVGECCG